MKVSNFSEARQQLGERLNRASREGGMEIRRRDGQAFWVRPAARSGSPLDVPGIDAGLSRKEILDLVRESRAPQLTVSSVPVFRGNRVRLFLFDLDEITDHPEFKLFEAGFPAALEILHPLAALRRIGHVHYQPHEIVPVDHTAVAPVALQLLSLVTGSAEVVDDFQDGFCQPLGRDIPTIIELKREQHLESPPVAAHRWFCPRL